MRTKATALPPRAPKVPHRRGRGCVTISSSQGGRSNAAVGQRIQETEPPDNEHWQNFNDALEDALKDADKQWGKTDLSKGDGHVRSDRGDTESREHP